MKARREKPEPALPIPAVRGEVKSERISRKIHRHTVVHLEVNPCQAWLSDALHAHLLRRQRELAHLRLEEDGVAQILISLVGVGTPYHRNFLQVVLKLKIRHFRWNDLYANNDRSHDQGNPENHFDCTHCQYPASPRP